MRAVNKSDVHQQGGGNYSPTLELNLVMSSYMFRPTSSVECGEIRTEMAVMGSSYLGIWVLG